MKTSLLALLHLLLVTTISNAGDAIAFQLACIDAGKQIEENDPIIEKYQESLTKLSKIYKITELEVGDQTEYSVKQLQNKGARSSILETMQAISEQGDDPINKTKLAYMKALAIFSAMKQVKR